VAVIEIDNLLDILQQKENDITVNDDTKEIIKILSAIKISKQQILRSYAQLSELPTPSLINKGNIYYVEAENGFQVTADLTIKGITEPVVFTAIPTASSEEGVTLVADIAFDRALYDVQFGSESFFDNLGDQIIKDEIVMQVSLVAKRSE